MINGAEGTMLDAMKRAKEMSRGCKGEETYSVIAAVEDDIYGNIDKMNGWHDASDLDADTVREINRKGAQMVYEIFRFVTNKIPFDSEKGMKRALVRMVSAIWVIMPGMLQDKKKKVVSLEQMGDALGLSRCWVSMVAEEFSNQFSFFSRNQKSKASRVNYANGAKEGWRKRKEKALKDSQR